LYYSHILTEALNDKYMGLLANVGMDKTGCFQFLIDRVIMKISGWKEKLLSSGGKKSPQVCCSSYTRVCYVRL
jgi:hypothetical protein